MLCCLKKGDFIGTEHQLQERLFEVCGKEAEIENIQLHVKGYAFVTFKTHEIAYVIEFVGSSLTSLSVCSQCVWDQFQKQKICGKVIRVDWPYNDQTDSKKPLTVTVKARRPSTFKLWMYPLPRDYLKNARGIHDKLV
jgi:hypothetical protein